MFQNVEPHPWSPSEDVRLVQVVSYGNAILNIDPDETFAGWAAAGSVDYIRETLFMYLSSFVIYSNLNFNILKDQKIWIHPQAVTTHVQLFLRTAEDDSQLINSLTP